MQKALAILFIAVLLVTALNPASSSLLCAILAPVLLFLAQAGVRPIRREGRLPASQPLICLASLTPRPPPIAVI
jgi:hypothetical protein